MKQNAGKVKAITELKPPNNTKELKSFLGAIQYLAMFIPKLSEKNRQPPELIEKEYRMDLG